MKYIATIISGIALTALFLLFAEFRTLQASELVWKNEALRYSELLTTEKGVSSRRASEFTELSAVNENLSDEIKKNNDEIRYLTTINGELTTSLKNLGTTPGVIIAGDDSTETAVQHFYVDQEGFELLGYFEIEKPYQISFTAMKAALQIELAVTQNKDKIWSTYITSDNPNFNISLLEPKVSPYQESFLEKLNLHLGAYAGMSEVGVIGGASYEKHQVLLMFGTQTSIGYTYEFKIK